MILLTYNSIIMIIHCYYYYLYHKPIILMELIYFHYIHYNKIIYLNINYWKILYDYIEGNYLYYVDILVNVFENIYYYFDYFC